MPIQLKPPTADIPCYMQLMPPTIEEPETVSCYLSHLPQRMHDQEKLYSPPLRRHSERERSDLERLKEQKFTRDFCNETYKPLLPDYEYEDSPIDEEYWAEEDKNNPVHPFNWIGQSFREMQKKCFPKGLPKLPLIV